MIKEIKDMLKGIPNIISPELLKILMEMGHGDEIVLADGNFPGTSCAKDCIVVRADGHGVPELLDAILKLMPLDTYEQPIFLMAKTPGDAGMEIPIWEDYKKIVAPHTNEEFGMIERFAFYERAKKAYCIIQTGEKAVYANIILKKGVVKE